MTIAITTLPVLVTLLSTSSPTPETVRARQEVIAALVIKSGVHAEPLDVVEIEHDPVRMAAFPIRELEANGQPLQLPVAGTPPSDPNIRITEEDAWIIDVGSSYDMIIQVLPYHFDTTRKYAFHRDPYKFIKADNAFWPLLPSEEHKQPESVYTYRAAAEYATIYFGQLEYDKLIRSITIDTLVEAATNATDGEFFAYAAAYHAAANLSQLSEETNFHVFHYTTPGNNQFYFYPAAILHHTLPDSDDKYLTYTGAFYSTESNASAIITIKGFNTMLEVLSEERRQSLMIVSSLSAEAIINHTGFNQPVEPHAPTS